MAHTEDRVKVKPGARIHPKASYGGRSILSLPQLHEAGSGPVVAHLETEER